MSETLNPTNFMIEPEKLKIFVIFRTTPLVFQKKIAPKIEAEEEK